MNFNFDESFEALKKETIVLHTRWQIYEKIYGVSDDRIDLLNKSASSFFYNLQFILLDDIELIISKLLDPAKQGSHKNLSLETIFKMVGNVELKSDLKLLLDALITYSKEIRDRRNKRLSHYDLESSVVRSKELFTKASRKQINDILDKIREFLNLIEFHYYEKSTLYEYVSSLGDAETLIQCLKRSESYKFLEKKEKIECGFFRIRGLFNNA